ncbi:MAG: amidohydrolase family protein [Halioglobus sp.]|nr:amidohydrolase family protein [Halioglobus sp.]
MYLIRQCELANRPGLQDVRIAGGVIAAIASELPAEPGDELIEARGGALLPGLQDHHIHLNALAAALASLRCGPPHLDNADELAVALAAANHANPGQWLRGIGYHTSVAGDIDRDWLDRYLPDRPARIQHRGGRLWLLNSAGLAALGLDSIDAPDIPEGVERHGGRTTGRLFECDQWLRQKLRSTPPHLAAASALLASHGVTHLTDTSPGNSGEAWLHLREEQLSGRLLQNVRVMGSLTLEAMEATERLEIGEYKVHLLESQLPSTESVCSNMRTAREQGRNIAVHCVTLAELSFILDCFDRVGQRPGDRIEHAAVVPPDWLGDISRRGLRVITQPHFIAERGDQYREDVSTTEQGWLYRLRSLVDAGIPLAGGSDAPFGDCSPWRAMAAAVSRATPTGHRIGQEEALTPEQALALYTTRTSAPGVQQRTITTGAAASLCLLQTPWSEARSDLEQVRIAATFRDGELIHRAL